MPAERKSLARPDEVIRVELDEGVGLGSEDSGTHQLKGLCGEWQRSSLVP